MAQQTLNVASQKPYLLTPSSHQKPCKISLGSVHFGSRTIRRRTFRRQDISSPDISSLDILSPGQFVARTFRRLDIS